MGSPTRNNSENLTTDACPSPPRDDNETTNFDFKEEINQEPSSYRNYKKKKPKPKKSPTHAVANVININNSNGIHIGSNYTINMGKQQNVDNLYKEKDEVVKTQAICELLERTDPVRKDMLTVVSEHIGKNWRVVVRMLGYSDGQIHQYYEQYLVNGVREVVYQILLDWIQNKPDEAKVGLLFKTLWEASERDVVRRVADETHINTK